MAGQYRLEQIMIDHLKYLVFSVRDQHRHLSDDVPVLGVQPDRCLRHKCGKGHHVSVPLPRWAILLDRKLHLCIRDAKVLNGKIIAVLRQALNQSSRIVKLTQGNLMQKLSKGCWTKQ